MRMRELNAIFWKCCRSSGIPSQQENSNENGHDIYEENGLVDESLFKFKIPCNSPQVP